MNGLRRSSILGKRARHLICTTSDEPTVKGNSHQLYTDYKELNKRIRRITPLKLYTLGYLTTSDFRRYYPGKPITQPLDYEYHRIRTNEANGVLHIIQVGDFIPQYWLSDTWDDIHHSPIAPIKEISSANYGQRAKYVVTQYVSNQHSSYVRSSMSKNFIYPNWRADYENLKYRIYHQGIKKAFRNSKFSNWKYEWYTESERYAQTLDKGKYQQRFSPVVIPSAEKLLIDKWERLLDSRILQQNGGTNDENSSNTSQQPPPESTKVSL